MGLGHLQFNWNTPHGLGAKDPLRYLVTLVHINYMWQLCFFTLFSQCQPLHQFAIQ